jgi:hypothetical protein
MLPERAICFFVIVMLTLIGLVWGLLNTRRIIEAPFLYATGMALILCPQLYVVAGDSTRVPDEAFWVYCIMVMACTVALYLGYFQKPKHKRRRKHPVVPPSLDPIRTYRFGLALACLGGYGAYQLSKMGTITVWQGWAVYWINVMAFIVPGITLMLIAYARSPNFRRLIPIFIFTLIPLSWATDSGRRGATLTLPLMFALPFLIHNKSLRVPRWAIIVGLCLGFIVVYAFPVWRGQFKEHDYLQTMKDHPLSEIIEGTFTGNSSKPLEIADGMIVTGARYQFGNYEWGVSGLYNMLIANYVPGSIIGQDVKASLMMRGGIGHEWVTEAYEIPVAFYTAKSGYEDLFSQFSFLGCIVLYFVGRGYRKVHEAALHGHDGRAVMFLCFFLWFPASIAYGALTSNVILAIPQLAVMLLAFRWCLVKPKNSRGIVGNTFMSTSNALRRIPAR